MKSLILALAFLLSASLSANACPTINRPIQDVKGNAVAGASVYIYIAGTSTLAQLYSDAPCTLVIDNPITTSSVGMFHAYLPDGIYDVLPVKSGYSFSLIEDVLLEDRYTILSPIYSPSITLNRAGAQRHIITVTNSTAFTIQAPSGTVGTGSPLWVTIKNSSGGATGTITWASAFKMATFTAPGNGTLRSILFYWNGTNWIEDVKTPADVTY